MNESNSYRRGILIVLAVLFASALIVALLASREPAPAPAAQNLGEGAGNWGPFRLTERSGQSVSDADLADRVCIVSFIFTRCQLSCPRITGVMKTLQSRLSSSQALLVSLSVDPDHDTPEILQAYARSFDADPRRWLFLTGPRAGVYEMIQDRFKLSVAENPAVTPGDSGPNEAIVHSDRLALVDHGRIVGFFDSNDSHALDALVAQARRRATAEWVRWLPGLNASLNFVCTLLLLLGWAQIRQRSPDRSSPLLSQPRVKRHIACMSLAVLASAVFLTSYLVYHYQVGSVPFEGRGGIRFVYLTILLSHTVLAAFGVAPLVPLTLWRAWRGRYREHRSIAATTFPIWLYVAMTGVVIYLMLYRMSPPSS